jgi:hypothetical protein
MDTTAITVFQDLGSSETPSHSDHDVLSTQAPTSVHKALVVGDQHHAANSSTSDASGTPSTAASHPARLATLKKEKHFRFLVTTNPTQFKNKVMTRGNRKHVMNDFLHKERRRMSGTRDFRAEGLAEMQKRRRLELDHKKPKNSTIIAGQIRSHDTGVLTPQSSEDRASSSLLYGSDAEGAVITLASSIPRSVVDEAEDDEHQIFTSHGDKMDLHPGSCSCHRPRQECRGPTGMVRFSVPGYDELPMLLNPRAELSMIQWMKALMEEWRQGWIFERMGARIVGLRRANQGRVLEELRDLEGLDDSVDGSAVSPESSSRKAASLAPEWTVVGAMEDSVATNIPRSPFSGMLAGIRGPEIRVDLQEGQPHHGMQPVVSKRTLARATRPKDSAALASGMVVENSLAAERVFLDLRNHSRSSGSSMRESHGSDITDRQANQGQGDIWTEFEQRCCRMDVSSCMSDGFKDLDSNVNLQTVAFKQAPGVELQDMISGFTNRAFIDLPQANVQAFRTTTEPLPQHGVQNNPFRRRLEQLVEYLAWEADRTSSSTSSNTDSDDASSRSDHLDGHNGNRYHDGAPNSDSPDSVNDICSNRQHSSERTGTTSCDQPSGSSRQIPVSGPIKDHGNNGGVRTDMRQFQHDQETGKVIPCPLRLELKCAGMDENMSSLL